MKKQTGITLIALVITIIVLLILAGVSISAITGENGIIQKAKDAKEKTEKARLQEEYDLARLETELNTDDKKEITVEDIIEMGVLDKNTTAVDMYGNKIVIPAGFTIVEHNEDENVNVTYGYSGDTKKPTVQDGIVIENEEDGNQFVWIPVGNIKNKDNSITTIHLGRFTFDAEYDSLTKTVNGTGKIIEPMQIIPKGDSKEENAANVEDALKNPVIVYGAVEVEKGDANYTDYGNARAYNLSEFLTTTLNNGGYYIARFEASNNGNNIPASKINQTPWNQTSQFGASEYSQKMYPDSENVQYYSDLVNSYAWNTAIEFIQEYSEPDFSKKPYSWGNTFEYEGKVVDKAANIFNLRFGLGECTTEVYLHTYFCCAYRCGIPISCDSVSSSWVYWSCTFRPILCLR